MRRRGDASDACCAECVTSIYIGRVVVGVNGSPGSLQALRFALGLTGLHGATLVPVLAWHLPGGELARRRGALPGSYTRELAEIAQKQLLRAFDEGLGGLPHDVHVEPWVIRGGSGPVLVEAADQAGDLLVVGAGRRGMPHHALRASTARYCLAHAGCPVIAVPPPRLQAHLPSQLRLRHSTERLLEELTHSG